MRIIRHVSLVVAGFLLVQAAMFGLLMVGAAVPDMAVAARLSEDVDAGRYGPPTLEDRMGGTADTFTECVVAGTGLGAPELGIVQRAALMPRLESCAGGEEQIRVLAAGGQDDAAAYYFRYWAGYTAFTKPLIALFGLGGLRVLVGAALLAGLGALVWAIRRTVSLAAAVALVAPLVLASNVMSTPSTSLSHALAIATYLAGAGGTALAAARSLAWGLFAVGMSAAAFCFIDLLTTPAAGWMLSTSVIAGVTWSKSARLRETALAAILAGALWPVVFGATWVTRWIIAVPVAGFDVVRRDVAEKVLFRSSGDYEGVRSGFGAPTSVNVDYWLDHISTAQVTTLAVVMVVAVVLGLLCRRSLADGGNALSALLAVGIIGSPAAIAVVWYEALSNHSQIHEFFTYRNIPIALGVVAFAALAALAAGRVVTLAASNVAPDDACSPSGARPSGLSG